MSDNEKEDVNNGMEGEEGLNEENENINKEKQKVPNYLKIADGEDKIYSDDFTFKQMIWIKEKFPEFDISKNENKFFKTQNISRPK